MPWRGVVPRQDVQSLPGVRDPTDNTTAFPQLLWGTVSSAHHTNCSSTWFQRHSNYLKQLASYTLRLFLKNWKSFHYSNFNSIGSHVCLSHVTKPWSGHFKESHFGFHVVLGWLAKCSELQFYFFAGKNAVIHMNRGWQCKWNRKSTLRVHVFCQSTQYVCTIPFFSKCLISLWDMIINSDQVWLQGCLPRMVRLRWVNPLQSFFFLQPISSSSQIPQETWRECK